MTIFDLACRIYNDEQYMHCLRVANNSSKNKDDPIYNVALFHDAIKNSFISIEELAAFFSCGEIETILILTRRPLEPFFRYIRRIKNSSDSWAVRIKIADLKDEIEYGNFNKLSRYKKALSILKGE